MEVETGTSFTRLVGCRYPIQQAGMGVVSTPDLAVAVTEAGALGMLVTPIGPPGRFESVLEEVRRRIFYGDPADDLVGVVHGGGALAGWQVGSADEAVAAIDAGCDFVVAQGIEAGGHVRGRTGLLPLLDAVLGRVDVPVVAAGGIGSAGAVRAVLAAGASGARVGTRFLAAEEADVHPAYLDRLIEASAEDTVLTEAFSGGWPDAPHRVLSESVEAAGRLTGETVAEVEIQPGLAVPIQRFGVMPPGRSAKGNIAAMALYAGQSVGRVSGRTTAADVVRELVGGL